MKKILPNFVKTVLGQSFPKQVEVEVCRIKIENSFFIKKTKKS